MTPSPPPPERLFASLPLLGGRPSRVTIRQGEMRAREAEADHVRIQAWEMPQALAGARHGDWHDAQRQGGVFSRDAGTGK